MLTQGQYEFIFRTDFFKMCLVLSNGELLTISQMESVNVVNEICEMLKYQPPNSPKNIVECDGVSKDIKQSYTQWLAHLRVLRVISQIRNFTRLHNCQVNI